MFQLSAVFLIALTSLIVPVLFETKAESSVAGPLKIGFLFVGPISDWGWSYAQNEGRLFVDQALRGKAQTNFAENVPEVPDVLTIINALPLGARSVNPKVNVHVVWINSWSDPATEAEAAKSLTERGVDVLVGETMTVVRSAEKNHLYSIAYCGDLHQLAPKGWLTGQSWNWGPLYAKLASSVLDHTWKPGDYRYGLRDVCGRNGGWQDDEEE